MDEGDDPVRRLIDRTAGRVDPQEVSGRYPDAHALSKPCPPNRIIATMHEALAAA